METERESEDPIRPSPRAIIGAAASADRKRRIKAILDYYEKKPAEVVEPSGAVPRSDREIALLRKVLGDRDGRVIRNGYRASAYGAMHRDVEPLVARGLVTISRGSSAAEVFIQATSAGVAAVTQANTNRRQAAS